jgi:DNA-nicking Smr family endonuclease
VGGEAGSTYLRAGRSRDTLKKLRRAYWSIEDTLDLHGLTGDAAAAQAVAFLEECRERGVRCVRIVHGKGLGSGGSEPVLKGRIRRLLARRDEVLAFVEPTAADGGGGAVLVLLDA